LPNEPKVPFLGRRIWPEQNTPDLSVRGCSIACGNGLHLSQSCLGDGKLFGTQKLPKRATRNKRPIEM
jgi:hypothetical protein